MGDTENESSDTEHTGNIIDGDLVDLVQKFNHIYDKTNKLFKDEKAKYNSWQTIAFTLKSTPELCQQRWVALRARYVSELRKMKCIPSGSAATSSVWYLFNTMGFLSKHVKSRRSTKGNVPSERPPPIDTSRPSSSCWDTLSEIIGETENNENENSSNVSAQSENLENDAPSVESPAQKNVSLGELRKENKKRRKGETLPPVLEEAWSRVNTYFKKKDKISEDDTFGKLVVEEVKKIKNNDLQDELKGEILNLIFQYKRKDRSES